MLKFFSGVIIKFVLLAELGSQYFSGISFIYNYSSLLVRAKVNIYIEKGSFLRRLFALFWGFRPL